MNQSEAIMLCRLVKAACPSQAVDTYSPDAWAFMLDDIDYDDAKTAVRHLGRLDLEPGKSRYIEPGHVIAQVKRIRAKRLDDYGPVDPPSGLEPGQYLAWLRATNDAIASGRAPERPQLRDNSGGIERFKTITDGIGGDGQEDA